MVIVMFMYDAIIFTEVISEVKGVQNLYCDVLWCVLLHIHHLQQFLTPFEVIIVFVCVMQSQSDASPEVPTVRLHVDEEHLPFRENMFDLVISSLRYSTSDSVLFYHYYL